MPDSLFEVVAVHPSEEVIRADERQKTIEAVAQAIEAQIGHWDTSSVRYFAKVARGFGEVPDA